MTLRKGMIAVRHRTAALVSTVLALATAALTLPAAASAAVPGLGLEITKLPKTFTVGAGAEQVTAVVSSQQTGKLCRKVRWSMLLQVQGVNLNQVDVRRVEGDKPFAVRARTEGDRARLTDVQFDPGTLCAGGTVTATYLVAFSGGQGAATFQIDALDAAGRVLQTATATSQVAGARAGEQATPPPAKTEPPTADPSPSPSASDDDGALIPSDDQDPSADAVVPNVGTGLAQSETAARGNAPSLLIPGLIVGAVLVFLGVGLLLRLRSRNRGLKNRRMSPTSFYPAP